MLNDSLPSQIDIRKLVLKGTKIAATVPVSTLSRFADMLSEQSGLADVELQFYLDDQHIRRVDGHLLAKVNTICQRCLESMPLTIDTSFTLGVVWSEEDSQRLPANIEPLIVGEELVDLSDVVSEELILSLPIVSYHETDDCRKVAGYMSDATASSDDHISKNDPERENPFKILERLKPSSKR